MKYLMKYPQSQFELLVAGLKVLLPFLGITSTEKINERWMLHDLHFQIYVHYTKPIFNSKIKFGERLLPLTYFDLYPNNCVDDNIETAMKKAINQIFN